MIKNSSCAASPFKNFLFICFILVLSNFNIIGQVTNDSLLQKETEYNSPFKIIIGDFNDAIKDGRKLASSPLHYKSNDWIAAGLVISGTTIAFLVDNNIRNMAQRNHTAPLDKIVVVGKTYGEVYSGAIISGLVYAGGLVSGDKNIRETGRMLFETLAYAGIITTVLKSAIGRSRPYMNEGKSRFRGFQFKTGTTSMPSGHVTVAFAVSSVLASRINNIYASIGLYGLAGFTVFQRVYGDQHWLSDTILAASIATITGKAIVSYGEDRDKIKKDLLLYPSISQSGFGFGLLLGF